MFKEISKIKKECPVCEIERDLIYGEMNEVLKVRGEDIEITSKVNYCPEGKHYFYDVEDEEEKFQIAYREYRKRKGFLQPEEIKKIREQYGLSQKNFARLLGWGDITIHRYESGAIQDDVHNDVLSLIRDFDDFKKLFESKKNTMEPDLARKVEEKITAIEKEHEHRKIELLVKLLSSKTTLTDLPINLQKPAYAAHHEDFKYSAANSELALAA